MSAVSAVHAVTTVCDVHAVNNALLCVCAVHVVVHAVCVCVLVLDTRHWFMRTADCLPQPLSIISMHERDSHSDSHSHTRALLISMRAHDSALINMIDSVTVMCMGACHGL